MRKKGFSIIEILVGAAIFTGSLVSIANYYTKAITVARETNQYIQGAFLLEEGGEALRVIRDQGWTAGIAPLSTGTTYYFYWSGTTWQTTTTPQWIENTFLRSLTVADVSRDANDDIASSGTNDPGTKKFTVSVAWQRQKNTGTTTQSTEMYLMNIYAN